jgi:hypothetical protein
MDNPLSKVLISAPPAAAAEVKIRTMRSDIDSMTRSGGGAPSFQNVAVSGLSLQKEGHKTSIAERTPMPAPSSYSVPSTPVAVATMSVSAPHIAENNAAPIQATDPSIAPTASPQQEFPSEAAPKNHLIPILIVTLVAIIAIGVVGYFAYVLFFK